MASKFELNSFSEIFKEFKEKYSNEDSLLRGFDAIILFSFITAVFLAIFTVISNGFPFESMISSFCGAFGLMVIVLALRLHLTKEIKSKVSPERAFVDFLLCMLYNINIQIKESNYVRYY